jgi:hypothetical protein|tara:strand:- start:790 stop:954 length:165 start_codon:yes stop_codon:yes gene_type:complete
MEQQLEQEIKDLKEQLSDDMIKDMKIREKIHNLEMKLNGVKPEDSHFECLGCGS